MADGVLGYAETHPTESVVALIVLAVAGGALVKHLSPSAATAGTAGTSALVPAGTLGSQSNPYVEYIPTSYSVTSELNSGNITGPYAAPGGTVTGPVSVTNPSSNGSTGSTGSTGTPPPSSGSSGTTIPPVTIPPVTIPPVTTPPPTSGSGLCGFTSALDARNRIGDGTGVSWFAQFRIPSWVYLWYLATNWQQCWPPSIPALNAWLDSVGLRNPDGSFTPLMGSATVPPQAQAAISAAFPSGGGYGAPTVRHTVGAGETLHSIAGLYGRSWHTIYNRNRAVIDSVAASHGYPLGKAPWHNLMPGTVLEVPA